MNVSLFKNVYFFQQNQKALEVKICLPSFSESRPMYFFYFPVLNVHKLQRQSLCPKMGPGINGRHQKVLSWEVRVGLLGKKTSLSK